MELVSWVQILIEAFFYMILKKDVYACVKKKKKKKKDAFGKEMYVCVRMHVCDTFWNFFGKKYVCNTFLNAFRKEVCVCVRACVCVTVFEISLGKKGVCV